MSVMELRPGPVTSPARLAFSDSERHQEAVLLGRIAGEHLRLNPTAGSSEMAGYANRVRTNLIVSVACKSGTSEVYLGRLRDHLRWMRGRAVIETKKEWRHGYGESGFGA
jgi:hypothetical protein